MPSEGSPTRLSIFPKASSNCGTVLACVRKASTAASTALATVGAGRLPSARLPPSPEPCAQNGGMPTLLARSVDMVFCMSFIPLTPSIKE